MAHFETEPQSMISLLIDNDVQDKGQHFCNGDCMWNTPSHCGGADIGFDPECMSKTQDDCEGYYDDEGNQTKKGKKVSRRRRTKKKQQRNKKNKRGPLLSMFRDLPNAFPISESQGMHSIKLTASITV